MSKTLGIPGCIVLVWLCLTGYCEAADDPGPLAKPAAQPVKVDQSSLVRGYEFFKDGKFDKACPYLYQYISAYSPDVDDYEWAEFFLGVSLHELGFSHAAADILAGLVSRKPDTRIVEYSLRILENTTRTSPFDHDLIINQTICDQEYGFIERDLSDFIHYYQGVYDWENGFYAWGDEHFAKIAPDTYFFYKYLNQKALLKIYQDRIEEAKPLLRQILASNCRDGVLMDEVRKTFARLLYETGEFEKADFLYLQIEKSILEQSQNLMERAWAHYRMGNPERAMGLLYSFEAPSFRNYFTPEYYILKSFIYKDVCHYQSALRVVEEFKGRYGRSLDGIHRRGRVVENNEMLLLLLNKNKIRQTWEFLQLLEKERTRCGEFKGKGQAEFGKFLDRIYELQIAESTASIKNQIEFEYEKYADELLRYEEEAHLMAYEVGLDMYQKASLHSVREDKKEDGKQTGAMVVYPFQGEFWNDELSDLKVVLPNKCKNMEEWDIFFK